MFEIKTLGGFPAAVVPSLCPFVTCGPKMIVGKSVVRNDALSCYALGSVQDLVG